ncbi:MAG: CoB--CoM heterodisulfide reductase iron-sulfur subunit A family protein, partial [Chloroflexi bacterium]|nr:CoB--CoM heterodisulfide reductase iron-sulfur subunit A family protein [Chloroflexota bacterium]
SGPFGGEMIRPSDRKHPKKIAWIQCVGSRQVTPGGNSYCSAVCCMYTTKQVILAKDHDSNVETTVFHNDIRAYGKDFERYYNRAAAMPGVRYIRSYVTIGREVPGSKNVTIKYSTDDGVKEEEFDLVVLSVGLAASPSAEKLANKLSIELNQHRFCNTGGLSPMETNRPGIYASGAFQGPMDIPESVMSGSGAAALCGQLLAGRRGELARERVYPAERDVSGEEPRVGVFACHCGTNIGSVVDVPALVEYAKELGNVVYVQEDLYTCSSDTAQKISETIREKGLNRVIVSACTPRTHEPIFQDTLREGGINKYLFVMANIREHCSWVHAREKEKATQKAKDITRVAVARALSQRPLEEFEVPVNKRGLVVGGGVAGMVSALSLAEQGFEVYLVEKEAELGGVARRIHFTLDGMDVDAYRDNLIQRVKNHPLIQVITKATIIGSSGYVGNFVTKIMTEEKVDEIEHGVVIIATGSQEYKPTEYLYGKSEQVVTLLELEELIAKGDTKILDAQSLVMIQCVGCRQEDRPYCSRICCGQAVKCALKLKEKKPDMDIYILYRDMRTYGFKEDYYREASDKGVNFILYEAEDKPQVETVEINGKPALRVTVTDPILGQKVALNSDILALAAAVIPTKENNKEISQLFKVPVNQDGFFLEAHVKLRPVDFTVDGIFICGLAHYPKYLPETISQAYAAAGRAATVLSKDTMVSSGAVCEVDEKECIGCAICESVCPFKAITMKETAEGLKANVIPVVCKACGICNVKCPTGAISLKHFKDEQIFTQIDTAFSAPVGKELQPV